MGVTPAGGTRTVTDFFSSGGGDLTINTFNTANDYWAGLIPLNGLEMAVLGGNVSPRTFSLNDLIGPTTVTWSSNPVETLFNYAPGGNEQKSGNIGFGSPGTCIALRSSVGGSFSYGWMEVAWDSAGGWGGEFYIVSSAYENVPNMPIGAGSFTSLAFSPSAAVPGPLPLLGAAAAFAHGRRLRARLRNSSSPQA